MPLGHDDVDAVVGAAAGVSQVPHQGHDLHALFAHALRPGPGRAQAGDEDGDLLFEDDVHQLVGVGQALGQKQVDAEDLAGEALGLPDLIPERLGVQHRASQDAQAAGVGDGGRQLGQGDAAHAGLYDRTRCPASQSVRLEHVFLSEGVSLERTPAPSTHRAIV
jgi:hypothetical protein